MQTPWSVKHDACVECHTTEIPVQGKGLCRRCYLRHYAPISRASKKRKTWQVKWDVIRTYRELLRNISEGRGRRLKRHFALKFRCDSCAGTHAIPEIKKGNLFRYYFDIYKRERTRFCRQGLKTEPPRGKTNPQIDRTSQHGTVKIR